MIQRIRGGLCAALVLLPGAAQAHAFRTGADVYTQFIEGVGVPLADPALVLCLLPLGLLAGLWRPDAMPKLWPVLIPALILGGLCASLAPPEVAIAAVSVGAATACIAALARTLPSLLVLAMGALGGAVAGLTALQGHGFGELSLAIHLGLLLGANLVVAIPAALVKLTLPDGAAMWRRIGWRVAASWSGAVAVMFLAFQIA